MATISKRQRARFYIYKKQNKNRNVYIYIQKTRHFAKIKTIFVAFLFTKSQTLDVTKCFMKIIKLAFIYKSMKFCVKRRLYKQMQDTSQKPRQFLLRFKYTKILIIFTTQFLMELLKLAEDGGGGFL